MSLEKNINTYEQDFLLTRNDNLIQSVTPTDIRGTKKASERYMEELLLDS